MSSMQNTMSAGKRHRAVNPSPPSHVPAFSFFAFPLGESLPIPVARWLRRSCFIRLFHALWITYPPVSTMRTPSPPVHRRARTRWRHQCRRPRSIRPGSPQESPQPPPDDRPADTPRDLPPGTAFAELLAGRAADAIEEPAALFSPAWVVATLVITHRSPSSRLPAARANPCPRRTNSTRHCRP